MEFLKDIALQQSLENYKLVILVTALNSVIFLLYISFVSGLLSLSLHYLFQARKENSVQKLGFAFQLAEFALHSKSVIIFLGIIPGAALVFSFAQILQSTPAISVTLAGIGFFCAAIGLWLLYSFKETFRIQEILTSYQNLLKVSNKEDSAAPGLKKFEADKDRTFTRSGIFGIIFLLAALYLYSAAFVLAADPSTWPEIEWIFGALISFSVWIKFIEFLALTAGITGLGVLYFIAAHPVNLHETALITLKKTCTLLSLTALLTMPLILLVQTAGLSIEALSGSIYLLTGFGVILYFAAAHFLYAYRQSAFTKFAAGGFIIFLLAASINVVTDSIAIGTATREHAAFLSIQHEKNYEELKTSLGVSIATFNGEEIYNARCSTCHLFDQKKIGPPYIETIPKYLGKKSELISFILNPMKKNPDYPPMTNPGLKQAEADSVASYIMQRISSIVLKPTN